MEALADEEEWFPVESRIEPDEGFWVRGMVPKVAEIEDDLGNRQTVIYISMDVFNRSKHKNELLDFFLPMEVWEDFCLRTRD